MNIKLAYKNFASFDAPGSGYKKMGGHFLPTPFIFYERFNLPFLSSHCKAG
jgi:hypothetical protein